MLNVDKDNDNVETDNNSHKNEYTPASLIIGYVLLSPSIISVLLFFYQFTVEGNKKSPLYNFDNSPWVGDWGGEAGGYTSALPLYFGLMALAGAYLIKK